MLLISRQAGIQPPPTKAKSGPAKLLPSEQSLIDFSEDFRKSKEMRHVTKVSVLEAFDPLLLSDEDELTDAAKGETFQGSKSCLPRNDLGPGSLKSYFLVPHRTL